MNLNVDGGSFVNLGESSGGDIIRNALGRTITGFAHHYGSAINNIVECKALLDGFRLCRRLGLKNVLVESD